MSDFLKALRILGEEGRVRILRLLAQEELSVAELQEILGMGQSRISMQLAQLKQSGFAGLRRVGQKSLYRAAVPAGLESLLDETLRRATLELATSASDDEALRLILKKRTDKLRGYFDELAGRFGRNYVPGRSWQGLAEMLMRLLPELEIADLGAGEGTLTLMLAQRARRVIAVDNSEKMVEYGAGVAASHGVENVEYRLGDLEDLPVESASVDLALFHQSLHHAQHPQKALAEAWRILRPGGRLVVMDLLKHSFEEARELYADLWFGFSRVELIELLRQTGCEEADFAVVHREA